MKKTAPKKPTVKKVSRPTKSANPQWRKYLLIVAAVLLVLFVLPPTKKPMAYALAQTGLFTGSATVTWEKVDGAASYNIYYKRVGSHIGDNYAHAVRNIPADTTSYIIKGLKRGKTYEYKISAVDASGKEFLWTAFQPTDNIQ